MRITLIPCGPALCALALAACSSTDSKAHVRRELPPRPNIVFIFADDHASHAISAYGSILNETPNIDRLAREGMLFRNTFCGNSICAPSRATVLTGKHSHKNGVIDNAELFDGAQWNFAKALQGAGYQTAMIGKWHLKTDPTGFDHWEVLIGQGPYYNPPLKTPAGTVKHEGYTTDIITDRALDWLANGRDEDRPFLLMYQHKAPHREWEPGPAHITMYDDVTLPEPATLFDDYAGRTSAAKTQEMTIARHMRMNEDLKLAPPRNLTPAQLEVWNAAYEPKNEAFRAANLEGDARVRWMYQRYVKDYLRSIASVDDNVGRVLDWLEENDLEQNTVVVYSSDQGFYLGDHGWYDKRWMYEESLRMPFLVRWPAAIEAGSVNASLTQNIDFAPTFCELAGAETPPDVQGASLVPLLLGGEPEDWRESIYYHYYEFPGVHAVQRHFGVRTERYKLIRYYLIDEWELFDLERDPDELRSVHADPAYAEIREELERELLRLQEQYGETDPTATREDREQTRAREAAAGAALSLVFASPAGRHPKSIPMNVARTPLTVGARCVPSSGDGVLVAHGGESLGYSLYLVGGRPHFAVRNHGALFEVSSPAVLRIGADAHVAGVIDASGDLELWVDGARVARGPGRFIGSAPREDMQIGVDEGSRVGGTALAFAGELSRVRLYRGVWPFEERGPW